MVYHPEYSAPQLAAGHRFPMQVFRRIYELLLEEGVVLSEQVPAPMHAACYTSPLLQVQNLKVSCSTTQNRCLVQPYICLYAAMKSA